jgi:hypothetical protein
MLKSLFPNLPEAELDERAISEIRKEYESSRSKLEEDVVTQNAKTAREDLLANITYAKDTDGASSPEYLSALKQLTPQQINDLKTNPTTRTELEAAGIQLDVNFEAMGLDAGDSVEAMAKRAGVVPSSSYSYRNGKMATPVFNDRDKVSFIEKDGDIFFIKEITRKFTKDSVWGVKSGRDDITHEIIGYNVRTGQEEILWDESKG